MKLNDSNGDTAAPTEIAHAFFEDQALTYSSFYQKSTQTGAAVLFQLRAEIAASMVSAYPAEPLLDLATGTGEITHEIVHKSGIKTLILNDFSSGMLSGCKKVFLADNGTQNIEWSNQDAFEVLHNIGEAKVGTILCLGLIAHTGRLSEILELATRALRPNGTIVLQSSIQDHVGSRLVAAYAASSLRRTRHRHFSFYLADIEEAAKAVGLKPISIQRFGVAFPFGDKISSWLNFRIERLFARRMKRFGGEIVMSFRKPG